MPRPVLLVGQPNVGKSALFGRLTGRHATVSNFPGTTVTVTQGTWRSTGDDALQVLDTPGAYSLLPITDEERVTRDALFREPVAAVLHVVQTVDLDRALATTMELIAAGLPVVLVLNMWDEAQRLGVEVDVETLAARLGCPVVPTVAVRGEGVDALAAAVAAVRGRPVAEPGGLWVEEFGPVVDELARSINGQATLPPAMPHRIAAVLALRGSRDITASLGLPDETIGAARRQVAERVSGMPPVAAILALRARAAAVLDGVFVRRRKASETLRHRFGLALAHPLWGLPFVALVLYLGFYQLVGVGAADVLVGFLEETVFGTWLMPSVRSGVEAVLPPVLSGLFVGEYGVLTLGITYALALVLPVVGAFFIVFSIVEDSGYLPRLALLCDRLFKVVGLNGRAVITMVLGFGCSTMATVTTRTLEQPRERVIATLLLVSTIPCSAQLGLITALLAAQSFTLWLTYVGCLFAVFLGLGIAASKLLPGRNATFHMELVPMRMPRAGNVLRKTWQRLYWYFREVVPLFVLASVALWVLDLRSAALFGMTAEATPQPANALHWLLQAMQPVMAVIGQPIEAAESFLIGFVRRDFGGAGLYMLAQEGKVVLTDRQILVGSFTMTLFVPCVASFMMMWKERGARVALVIFGAVTALALGAGGALNQVLLLSGWR